MSSLVMNLKRNVIKMLTQEIKVKHCLKNTRIRFASSSFTNNTLNARKIEDTNLQHPKNIVFFGTDDFGLCSLKCLLERKKRGLINSLHVVTASQKSRRPPVLKFCVDSKIPFTEWPMELPPEHFDIGIVVSFGHLIPSSIINSFPLGILNAHGSLLPRWRGSSPIVHSILSGDKETGITIMKIAPDRFDVGEIVYQEKIIIEPDMKSLKLTEKMALLGANCIGYCLDNMETLFYNSKPQPSTGITKAPKIKEIDCEIIWSKMTAQLIRRMYLAFDDYFPLWTFWNGRKVKLRDFSHFQEDDNPCCAEEKMKESSTYKYIKFLKSENAVNVIEKNDSHLSAPGKVLYLKKERVLRIRCLGGFVHFRSVAVKGKRKMTALEFYNGYLSKVGENERYFR